MPLGNRLVTLAVVMTGSWQQLTAEDVVKCERISFRGASTNAGIIGIADAITADADGAASTGGEVVPIPVDGVPAAPLVYESAKMWYQLNQFWVRGTAADILYLNLVVLS